MSPLKHVSWWEGLGPGIMRKRLGKFLTFSLGIDFSRPSEGGGQAQRGRAGGCGRALAAL